METDCFEKVDEIVPQAVRMLAQVLGDKAAHICRKIGKVDDEVCKDHYNDPVRCLRVAANNWCRYKVFKRKCCASCKRVEKEKDPCHDEYQSCVNYKGYMCRTSKIRCKKTCGLCTPAN